MKNSIICPVCLEEKTEFHKHHVVSRSDKGSNDPINILGICRSCHALITFGSKEDRVPREMYCICYQMARHGLSFLLRSNAAFFSPWKESIDQHGKTQSASEYDKLLKECAGILCQRYRQIINQEVKGEFSPFQPLSEIA